MGRPVEPAELIGLPPGHGWRVRPRARRRIEPSDHYAVELDLDLAVGT
jgi:hypothetical protein